MPDDSRFLLHWILLHISPWKGLMSFSGFFVRMIVNDILNRFKDQIFERKVVSSVSKKRMRKTQNG